MFVPHLLKFISIHFFFSCGSFQYISSFLVVHFYTFLLFLQFISIHFFLSCSSFHTFLLLCFFTQFSTFSFVLHYVLHICVCLPVLLYVLHICVSFSCFILRSPNLCLPFPVLLFHFSFLFVHSSYSSVSA